jgi:hypothetical protein
MPSSRRCNAILAVVVPLTLRTYRRCTSGQGSVKAFIDSEDTDMLAA